MEVTETDNHWKNSREKEKEEHRIKVSVPGWPSDIEREWQSKWPDVPYKMEKLFHWNLTLEHEKYGKFTALLQYVTKYYTVIASLISVQRHRWTNEYII